MLNSATGEFYPGAMIRDVTEATFQQDVIDRSHEVPVVVDFWAAWCGPCRQLTPLLEDEVRKREPELDLAKLDTDANQQISAAFRIQGIPAVKAFKDGKVVDEFVGAQPPPQVKRFLDGLLPSEADGARRRRATRRRCAARSSSSPAAPTPPSRSAGCCASAARSDDALAVLGNATGSYAAEGLAARIRLEDDPELHDAFAALDAGDTATRARRADRRDRRDDDEDRRDELRRAVVGVLDELGAEHPLARESRRKLAAALY